MKCAIATATLIICTPFQFAYGQDDLCGQLAEIAAQGSSGFEQLKGGYDTDRDVWTSTTTLPGASPGDCYIASTDGYFHCFWNMQSKGAAIESAQTWESTIRGCTEWQITQSQTSHSERSIRA
jgi:hypothetical protein